MSPNLLFRRLPVTFPPVQAQAQALGTFAQAYLFSQPAVVGMCSRPAVTADPSADTDKHVPSHAGVTPTNRIRNFNCPEQSQNIYIYI